MFTSWFGVKPNRGGGGGDGSDGVSGYRAATASGQKYRPLLETDKTEVNDGTQPNASTSCPTRQQLTYLSVLIVVVLVVLTGVAFYIMNARFRKTVIELRSKADANQAKYDIVRTNMDKLNIDLHRLRTTVVQRDAEIEQLKKGKSE
jgi:hypothetical protein